MSTEYQTLEDLEKQFKHVHQAMTKLLVDFLKGICIPIDELFSPAFMKKYSSFSSLDDLLELHIVTPEDLKAIPEDQINAHVSQNSKFSSWEEMMQEAISQYVKKKIDI